MPAGQGDIQFHALARLPAGGGHAAARHGHAQHPALFVQGAHGHAETQRVSAFIPQEDRLSDQGLPAVRQHRGRGHAFAAHGVIETDDAAHRHLPRILRINTEIALPLGFHAGA